MFLINLFSFVYKTFVLCIYLFILRSNVTSSDQSYGWE